ncbi:MAG: 8-amino-7-oxononanoate synthase [Zetaproteobacteria bacterium]|nr:MAG: 8-amino-7-oxononanoate synthase [Zetaproteobacteria bacterium]
MDGLVAFDPAITLQDRWFAPPPADARRSLEPHRGRQGLVCFCSNDYLGLRDHPQVVEAAARLLHARGVGSGGSRLISGDHPLWHRLADELACWLGFEAGLTVGSGMLLNIGLIQALADRHTALFCDRLNHASLIDGARLSGARHHRFPHRDYDALEARLARCRQPRRLIVSDGLFSMDGDCADIRRLIELAERHDALLLIDDAHGIGTMGGDGRGVTTGAGGHPRLVLVGTLGKAFGGYGAFVLARRALIDGLIQRMRTLIYSTGAPPLLAAAGLAALARIREGHERARLAANMELFARLRGVAVESPIIPWSIGSDRAALEAADILRRHGMEVVAIRPPTVPRGTARLRITRTARHTPEQIAALSRALDALRPAAG